MKPLKTPPSDSAVRRLLASYFEFAQAVPGLLVSVPAVIHHGGTDWPVLKVRMTPPGEPRQRLLVVAGLSPLDRGSVDAVFQAVLRLLQDAGHYHHAELVAFPLANPVAVAAEAPAAEEEVRRLLLRELATERYDGLLVLHDEPLLSLAAFRAADDEHSRNLAAELLDRVEHSAGAGLVLPLLREDLEASGLNEGTATVVHALLPAARGRTECARLGAGLILETLAEYGAIEELWRRTA